MRRLDITPNNYRVRDFVSWQRHAQLELTPRFQRRSVWKAKQRSYFIDTIWRGLPVPIIYIRERAIAGELEPRREIVDGQQRLRALFLYIDHTLLDSDPDFLSRGLLPADEAFTVLRSHNEVLKGKQFARLEEEDRNAILDYRITVQVLPADTDDREILAIFARLNSTGTQLNPQELLNASYFGDFKTAMYDLAYEQLNRWRDWGLFREEEIARMNEVEAVSDFIVLMFNGLSGRSAAAIKGFYERFDDEFPARSEVEKRFRSVMDAIETTKVPIADTAFRNLMHFYTLFAFVYDKMYGLGSRLVRKRPAPLPRDLRTRMLRYDKKIRDGAYPDDLREFLSGRTTHAQGREARLAFFRSIRA